MISKIKLLGQTGLNQIQKKYFSQSLYTWGLYSSGLGYKLSNEDPSLMQPRQVDLQNITQVSTGQYHSAAVTANGELYTFGSGKYGALGHGRETNEYEPRMVEFFAQQKQKVTDVSCGFQNTIARTENGQLWSWGYGGQKSNPLIDWAYTSTGALGSGQKHHRTTPDLVETSQFGPIRSFTSGDKFAIALNENQQVIQWGEGSDGSFGEGNKDSALLPQLNYNFEILKQKNHITIDKVKSTNHFTVALFSDGHLYSWGRNEDGCLGIRKNIGIKTDQVAYVPTPVVNDNYANEKVVDFDVGFNTLVLLTDQNNVYWCGMGLVFKPNKFHIPNDKKIKSIVACKDSFAAVDGKFDILMYNTILEDNQLYMFNEFVLPYTFDPMQEFKVFSGQKLFDGRRINKLGGGYGLRYALIE